MGAVRWADCAECEGQGGFQDWLPFGSEDDDWVPAWVECGNCEGEGFYEDEDDDAPRV